MNCHILSQVRRIALQGVASADGQQEPKEPDQEPEEPIAESVTSTFALPNLMQYPEAFKAFLFKDLIEMSTLVSLEQGGWFRKLCVLNENFNKKALIMH
jgi:hypothetical protein